MSETSARDAASAGRVVNPQGRVIYVDAADRRGAALVAKDGEAYPRSSTTWRRALELSETWDVVVDVGANYGEMLAGADLSRARRIIAFEPNASVGHHLALTVAELPWDVEIIEAAVSDHVSDAAQLHVTEGWSGTSYVASSAGERVKEGESAHRITQTTLSEALREEAPSSACIKIDVEGHEAQALDGATDLLETVDRVAVMIEIRHIAVETVWDLTRRLPLYLLDLRTESLVRWEGESVHELGRDLHSGRYYRQDAVLLGGRDVERFDAERREALGTVPANRGSETARLRRRVREEQEKAAGLAKRVDRLKRESTRLAGELTAIKGSRMYRLSRRVWAITNRLRRRP